MILSTADIFRLRQKNNEKDPNAVNPVGHKTQYCFLTHDKDGISGVCGVNAVMIGMRPGDEGPDSEKFYVDLGIQTHVDGFYSVINNIAVCSLVVVATNDSTETQLVEWEHADEVIRIMREFTKDNGKPKLRLVHSEKKS